MKRPGLLIARLAIVLGVVGSLAGNTAWAWPHPILVGVGVFMSLVLPTSVALWKATGQRSGWQRAERATVMGFIALAAASYTLWHAGLLLHDQGLDWVLAMCVPLAGESLVVMAARALSPQPAVQVQSGRAPRKPTARTNGGPPKSVADVTPKPPPVELPAQPIEWARMRLANGDPAGWRSILRNHPDLTEHAAKQAATEAKAHTTNGTSLHAVGGRS